MKESSGTIYPVGLAKTVKDGLVELAYNDPQFQADIDALITEAGSAKEAYKFTKTITYIASKYPITPGDVKHYLILSLLPGARNDSNRAKVSFDDNEQLFYLKFPLDISRAELIDRVNEFVSIQKSLGISQTSKRKLPKHIDLLYAVDKALRRKESWSTIHNNLMDDDLDGYTGSADEFTDINTLRNYYRKYMPPGL